MTAEQRVQSPEQRAAAIAQGERIRDAVADVCVGLDVRFDTALDLVAGALIGLPKAAYFLGMAGEYVVLDDVDEVEFRLRAIEAKYKGMASAAVAARMASKP